METLAGQKSFIDKLVRLFTPAKNHLNGRLPDLLEDTAIETRRKRFSFETARALERIGFETFEIEIESIREMVETSGLFGVINKSDSVLSSLPEYVHVAVNIGQIFIPDSNNLAFGEQEEKLKENNAKFEEKGIKAASKILSVGTVAGLEKAYRSRTGKNLISGGIVRTNTFTAGLERGLAAIGRIREEGSLFVVSSDPSRGNKDTYVLNAAVPL